MALLLKIASFYLLFIALRQIWRGYRFYKLIQTSRQKKTNPQKNQREGDVFEADYRNLDDDH